MSNFQNIRPFQIAMYFGFGILMIIAIIILNTADLSRDDSGPPIGQVTIWGTLDESTIRSVIRDLGEESERFRTISYRQIDPAQFERTLVNAIVERRQPDVLLIPHRKLVEHRSKLLPIPFESYSRRRLQDEHLDGFEIFARQNGLYAVPFVVDPLVMYWNRDIFANNGLVTAPQTWEDFTGTVFPAVIRRTPDRTISQSPIAFGLYENNRNAFASLSMLLLQAGSRMVEEERGQYRVNLNSALPGADGTPLTNTVRFFTRFADSNNTLYSWNRSKREDRQEFLSDTLALYFGMGSEFSAIQRQNPNLNFDVTTVPQSASATTLRTYGDFYGFAILQTSNNRNGAFEAIQALTQPWYTALAASRLDMAPSHRQTIAQGSSSAIGAVVFRAAPIARGWLNPKFEQTEQAFDLMIRDIQAGRASVSQAVSDLQMRLRQAF